MAATDTSDRSGRWIPWYFVLVFLVVFAVNGFFIYISLHTFTGTTIENPYQRGLAYNSELDRVAAQKALGWKGEVTFQGEGGKAGILRFSLQDAKGQPITGAKVQAKLVRPMQDGYDNVVTLDSTKAGYEAKLQMSLPGVWDAYITADYAGNEYRQKERLVLQ